VRLTGLEFPYLQLLHLQVDPQVQFSHVQTSHVQLGFEDFRRPFASLMFLICAFIIFFVFNYDTKVYQQQGCSLQDFGYGLYNFGNNRFHHGNMETRRQH
jgi:hypothetical protein